MWHSPFYNVLNLKINTQNECLLNYVIARMAMRYIGYENKFLKVEFDCKSCYAKQKIGIISSRN